MAKEVILTTKDPGNTFRTEHCTLIEEGEPGHDDIDDFVAFDGEFGRFWMSKHAIVRISLK
jgi:hypothetical protein